MTERPFLPVARVEDVPPGAVRIFSVQGRRIAVCRVDSQFHALDDRCTHDDGPLGEGTLCGDEVECPRHGARFHVVTGAARRMPAVAPVLTHETRVEGNTIHVRIKD